MIKYKMGWYIRMHVPASFAAYTKNEFFFTWSTQEGCDEGKSFGWKIGRFGTDWETEV